MLTAILAMLLFALVGPWLCDDVFVSLRYVQQALVGHGLVYNPGERVEGYTHFLWVVLLWAAGGLGLDLETSARWLPLPFYAASVLLLAQASRDLFARRPRPLWGVPVAAVLWALHRDAHVFASGGLETSAFTFWLVLGFRFLSRDAGAGPPRPKDARLAVWGYAMAALTRPEGLGHLALALAFLARRARSQRAAPDGLRFGRLCGLAILLVAPLFVWRLLYYGDLLPNSFHAKSAGSAYWSQGWTYVGLYFRFYAPLAAAAIGAWLVLAPGRDALRDTSAAPLRLAAAHAALVIVATAYVGGDFMFARFLLPATPFLLLLCERALVALPRGRTAAAALFAAALAAGGVWRERALHGLNFALHGIVDERSQYPRELMAARRIQAASIAECFGATGAVFLVQGSQASYAYWGRFPVAIEAYGLTDRAIARAPLVRRGRPGHERQPPLDYLLRRRTNFLIHLPGARVQREFARIAFGDVLGEILVYDSALMQQAARCKDVAFVDFPTWFDAWRARADSLDLTALQREAQAFRLYYFDHNDDRERAAQLDAMLRRAAAP